MSARALKIGCCLKKNVQLPRTVSICVFVCHTDPLGVGSKLEGTRRARTAMKGTSMVR
jgi:hypothetical protein